MWYDPFEDANMGETARKVVELAGVICEPVVVIWGDDYVVIYPGDEFNDALTQLEMSADDQGGSVLGLYPNGSKKEK